MDIVKKSVFVLVLIGVSSLAYAAVVWVSVTIDSQNNPVISPNPVSVATGDMLAFKLDAINYECPPDGHAPKVTLHFPPNGPVVDGYHEIRTNRTVASRVNWPQGMTSYTYYVISACSPGDPVPFTIAKADSTADKVTIDIGTIITLHWTIIAILLIIIAILFIITIQLLRSKK